MHGCDAYGFATDCVAIAIPLLQLVVPKVMGICVYHPTDDARGVSPQAERFCRLLVQRLGLNLFDKFESNPRSGRDAQGAVTPLSSAASTSVGGASMGSAVPVPVPPARMALLYELLSATAGGDVNAVGHLCHTGANVNWVDYESKCVAPWLLCAPGDGDDDDDDVDDDGDMLFMLVLLQECTTCCSCS